MNWKEIGGLVGKAAPMIGGLLGGPAGAAVGSVVAGVLGVEDTPEAVSRELAKNPEAFVKLRQAEIDKEKEFAKLASEDFRAELAGRVRHREIDTGDIQDARGRDLGLKQAGYHNRRADIMIVVAFIAFCFMAWMINANEHIKPEVLAIFNMAIGALLKMLGDAFAFEFGSSRGSKEKDLALPMAQAAPPRDR